MEFMIKYSNTASKSDSKYKMLFIFMMFPFVGYAAELVNGTIHQDVLLPCHGSYRVPFRFYDLVVTWQRTENDHVVHSFFSGTDQPQYQEKEFMGRTELFPNEFPNGKASLLLKNLRASDGGRYTCHYILDDDQLFTAYYVELQVQESEMPNSNTVKKGLLCWLIPACLLPLTICTILIVSRKKLKKLKPEDPEERLALHPPCSGKNQNCEILLKDHKDPCSSSGGPDSILSQHPVNKDPAGKLLKDLIETYRDKVHRTRYNGYKSINEVEKKMGGCLSRCLRAVVGKMWQKCTEDMFAAKDYIVRSEDMFTVKTSKLISRRMLIVGEAGIGKSFFSKGLEKLWASGANDIIYECIIYIPFSELNSIKEEISVKKLLGSKCLELSEVLTDLLDKEKVLIILDGLDEFNHELKDSIPSVSCDVDTSLNISTLISKIISKQLLPDTDVLVTSRFRSANKTWNYFSIVFILEAFTEDQIKEYCQKFMADDGISTYLSDFITTHNLSSLASIPLLSSALCEIHRKVRNSQHKEVPTTCSRMMLYLLKISLSREVWTDSLNGQQMSIKPVNSEQLKLPENLLNDFYQLCKISYKKLIFGLQVIKKSDLAHCPLSEHLFENLSEFFFKEDKEGEKFDYQHSSLRDMFAALYCVREIQNEEELEMCLDAWVFGKVSENKKSLLPTEITSHHWERLQNFNRFFFGLLPYGKHSLMSRPPPLSESKKESLKQWFQACIKNGKSCKKHFLNLLHCIFELHDEDVTAAVSQDIKDVNLFNIPLNSLDIHALKYCCQNSKPDVVDLRLCELGDNGLEQLKDIIKRCKEAKLSSNNLTGKSGSILERMLEHEDCAIEDLSLGTNRLGNAGTAQLFRGLEKNRSLRILSLKDNNIDDLGIESMAQSIIRNKTLQELHLCMNMFEEKGMKTIQKIQQKRPELKIVVRIAEDEAVLGYAEEKVGKLLSEGEEQYETEWLQQVLNKVLQDLKADAKTNESVQERVEKLKGNISKVLQKIDAEKIQDCNPEIKQDADLRGGLPDTSVRTTGPGPPPISKIPC